MCTTPSLCCSFKWVILSKILKHLLLGDRHIIIIIIIMVFLQQCHLPVVAVLLAIILGIIRIVLHIAIKTATTTTTTSCSGRCQLEVVTILLIVCTMARGWSRSSKRCQIKPREINHVGHGPWIVHNEECQTITSTSIVSSHNNNVLSLQSSCHGLSNRRPGFQPSRSRCVR